MAKRLQTIRRGIEYQDLVAAQAILEMVTTYVAPPTWISLENRRGGSFDDVVVAYADRVVWKQVKWAANPGSEPLTIDSLASRTSRRRTPLIRAFADSYDQFATDGKNFHLEFITNRAPDAEFRRLLTGSDSRIKQRLAKAQQRRLDVVWRQLTQFDEKKFGDFLQSLSFLVNSPDVGQLETSIRTSLDGMHCGRDAYLRLMRAIWVWASDENKERITLDDVDHVLGSGTTLPSNAFVLPSPRVDRPETGDELVRRIRKLASGYVIILGPPGCGKSTQLNTLATRPLSVENDLVVYNCFIGTSDPSLRTRATAENFATFLARRLYELYPAFGRLYEARDNIEAIFSRLSSCDLQRKLIIVIDGIDYAKQFKVSGKPALFDSLPIDLPDKVIVIVSAQVVDQLPPHLQHLGFSAALTIPPLDDRQIRQLLDSYGIFAVASLKPYEENDLVFAVSRLSSGHALHVNYVARELHKALGNGATTASVIQSLQPCTSDMEAYYDRIFSPPDGALARQSLAILAASRCELSANEIAAHAGPTVDSQSVEDALDRHGHLFDKTGDKYHFAHDSLRAFALSRLPRPQINSVDQIEFLAGLQRDPRTGEHLLSLVAENGGTHVALDSVDCDWIAEQISVGANTSLLIQGLSDSAVAAARQKNWGQMARWWSLKSCLERALWEADLNESIMINAWLVLGRRDIVERYIFVTSQFLSTVWPGQDLIDVLELHGHHDLAAQVADRQLLQSIPEISPIGDSPEFDNYVRRYARRASPTEVVKLIRQRYAQTLQNQSGFVPFSPDSEAARMAEAIVFECLDAGNLDGAESWLALRPTPFSSETRANLWLRLHLKRGDLPSNTRKVVQRLKLTTDIELLARVYEVGGFDRAVRNALDSYSLPKIIGNSVAWFSLFDGNPIRTLYWDLYLCRRLKLTERHDQIEAALHGQSPRVAHAFNSSIARLSEQLAGASPDWTAGINRLNVTLRLMRRNRCAANDVQAAEFYVRNLADCLRPAAIAAKCSAQAAQFGALIESTLWPSIESAGFGYASGLFSLCDLLQSEHMCPDVVTRLLGRLESQLHEEVSSKCGSVVALSTRYVRAGDSPSAERALTSGVRAAFTYGYSKDTTINYFILAFEAIGPHLGQRLEEVARFIASVLLILDDLTDGRMLYAAPAHFVAILCKFDVELATELGLQLQSGCPRLRFPLAPALQDHGLDVKQFGALWKKKAPGLRVGTVRQADNPRADFAAHDTVLATNPETFQKEVLSLIESSRFGSGLHRLPAVINSLLSQGRTKEATQVFDEFESAVRQLISVYDAR